MEFIVFFTILLRRKYIFISFFLLILLIPLLSAVWKESVYEASSVIIFRKTDLQTAFLEILPKTLREISFFDTKDTGDNLITLLQDDAVTEEVISKLGYDLTAETFQTSSPLLKFLFSSQKQAVSIGEKSGLEIFEVNGYALSQEEAVEISRTFVAVAADAMAQIKKSACIKIRDVIVLHNNEIEAQLEAVQHRKHLFQQQHNVADTDKELDNLYQEIFQNRTLKQQEERFLERTKKEQKAIRRQLAKTPEFHDIRQVMVKNPVLEKAEEKLAELLWEQAQKKTLMTNKHTEIIQHKELIKEVKDTIRTENKKILSSETKERNAYNTGLTDKYNDNLITIIGKQVDIMVIQEAVAQAVKKTIRLTELATKYQMISDDILLYKNILKENKNALNAVSVAEKMDLALFDVIHPADITLGDTEAFFPNYKRILFFSLFLAFWFAFTLALFVDYLDPALKSTERAETLLSIPVLTELPHAKGLIHFSLSNTLFRREEQAVRHILSWLKKEDRTQSCIVGVTSSKLGEGVSRTAALLADRLADTGERVLYVEANTIAPGLKKVFRCRPKYGLKDLISGQSSFSETAVWIKPDLAVLALSNKDKGDFYLGQNFPQKIISVIPEPNEFKWIFLDLPPVNEDAAAVDILEQCDTVFFQIALMKTTPTDLKKAFRQLMKKQNILDRTVFVANQHNPFLPFC